MTIVEVSLLLQDNLIAVTKISDVFRNAYNLRLKRNPCTCTLPNQLEYKKH
jgi:hypothetical protein